MHGVDQDVVVMYTLVKIVLMVLRVFLWFLSLLFEEIVISLKLELYTE